MLPFRGLKHCRIQYQAAIAPTLQSRCISHVTLRHALGRASLLQLLWWWQQEPLCPGAWLSVAHGTCSRCLGVQRCPAVHSCPVSQVGWHLDGVCFLLQAEWNLPSCTNSTSVLASCNIEHDDLL